MIYYEIANTVNFEMVDGVEVANTSASFPTIFGNKDFSFDVFFYQEAPTGNSAVASVVANTYPDYIEVNQIAGNALRISKNANTSLFDESYTFVSFDENNNSNTNIIDINLVSEYPLDNENLISWNTPPDETANTNAEANGTFQFDVLASVPEIIILSQDYRWSYEEGKDRFDIIIEETQ